jgi:hypothetical protein
LDDFSPQPGTHQKGCRIKWGFFEFNHPRSLLSDAAIARNFAGEMLLHRASICIPSREQAEKGKGIGGLCLSKLLIQKNIGSDPHALQPQRNSTMKLYRQRPKGICSILLTFLDNFQDSRRASGTGTSRNGWRH